jgi:DNA-binding LacI/PurR family transcriptional regulator
MNKNDKKINIYDIAEELGVAPSTISKAINKTGSVSAKTKKKIEDLIKEKGYVPNMAASSLKSRIGLSVAILYPTYFYDIMSHFFFSKVIENFRQAIESVGYEFSFVSHHMGNYEVSYLDYCNQRNVDGVFVLGATSKDEDVMEVVNSGIPCVSLDFLKEGVPYVQTDDILSAHLILEYIEQKKFQRVSYLSGPFERGDFQKRALNFIYEIKKTSLSFPESALCVAEASTVEDAKKACLSYIKEWKEIPDVIVTSNDEMAMGVCYALEEKGIKIPQEVSVIGFDDMYFSQYFKPSLTTIRQDFHTIGVTAAHLLTDVMNKKEDCPMENKIACQFIERESTKK